MLVVAGSALILVGALLGLWLWQASATAVEVVSVVAPVERGHVIDEASLGRVRITLDPSLRTVAWQQVKQLVGKRAAVELVPGQLVAPDAVTDSMPPAQGYRIVTVPVRTELFPIETLRAGDLVTIVVSGEQAGDQSVDGGLSQAGDGDLPQRFEFDAEVLNVALDDQVSKVDVVIEDGAGLRLQWWVTSGQLSLSIKTKQA
jgi:hypothetical protein